MYYNGDGEWKDKDQLTKVEKQGSPISVTGALITYNLSLMPVATATIDMN